MPVITSTAHLGPFEVGKIFALAREDYSHHGIRDRVLKEDGSRLPLAARRGVQELCLRGTAALAKEIAMPT